MKIPTFRKLKHKILYRYKYFPNVAVIKLFALAAPTTTSQ